MEAVLSLLMPPQMAPAVLLLLLLASFAGSFITVAFGIGGGAALLAVTATLVPPAVLIPVHGIIQAGSNFGRAALTFGHVHRPGLAAFALGTLVGASLGGVVVVGLPPAMVQIGVGGFILWSIFLRPPRTIRHWPLAIGVISSFLTMFFGATGVFVATYTKSLALPRHAHVATHATLMTMQHAIKTVTFALLGVAIGPWLPFTLAMIVAGFAGTVAGRQVLERIDDRGFKRILDVILVLLALRLIYGGVTMLLEA